jgi:F-type H+-transporting ATPase subunit gamma
MKALAASSIGQYEQSVRALTDYYRTVELALRVCFREYGPIPSRVHRKTRINPGVIDAIVFGSDQGLVGQFNDVVADYAVKTLGDLPGKCRVWAVGERVQARLVDAGQELAGLFPVPNSVQAITALVGQILVEVEAHRGNGEPFGSIALRARWRAFVAARGAVATRPSKNEVADRQPAAGHG